MLMLTSCFLLRVAAGAIVGTGEGYTFSFCSNDQVGELTLITSNESIFFKFFTYKKGIGIYNKLINPSATMNLI